MNGEKEGFVNEIGGNYRGSKNFALPAGIVA